MWKISLYNGKSLSCTSLTRLTNDSLYTIILGKTKPFAVDNISNMISFKNNINYALISGGLTGSLGIILISNYTKRDNNNQNRITQPIIGAISGTILAHILMKDKSINFSGMTVDEKNVIINSLVLNSQ